MSDFLPPKASSVFHAKRHLGQNFLVDRNILSGIVERARISPEDVILEIGPGQGVLTKELLRAGCAYLHAVELDPRLKDVLQALQDEYPSRLNVIWGDAMRTDCAALLPFPRKAVANIPYNITTPLIWKLLELAPRGLTYHLYMVQKEAADRLTALPDTKERYPLGITLEAMGEVTLVRRVPPGCFRPVPRVDSAIVEIVLLRNFYLMKDSLWSDLLHAGFRQRRKTLANNLKGFRDIGDWSPVLEAAGLDARIRAEDLASDDWLKLYSHLSPR